MKLTIEIDSLTSETIVPGRVQELKFDEHGNVVSLVVVHESCMTPLLSWSDFVRRQRGSHANQPD